LTTSDPPKKLDRGEGRLPCRFFVRLTSLVPRALEGLSPPLECRYASHVRSRRNGVWACLRIATFVPSAGSCNAQQMGLLPFGNDRVLGRQQDIIDP
jgi:hypothetical protein